MPELPDLEVFSKNLSKTLARKKLTKVTITTAARTTPARQALVKAIQGKTLKSVYREGKELRFEFSGKTLMGLHLMLHGKLVWVENEKPKHLLAQFDFGKLKLALTDFQRSARLTLQPEESDVPDALKGKISLKKLKELLQSRATIKNLLLDQKVIRGIGNAYADEILWAARISPASVAEKIPAAKIADLHKSIGKVLKDGMVQVARADKNIIGGEIRDFLLIHNSKKKESPGGSPIRQSQAGGRKTYYTDEQELYK